MRLTSALISTSALALAWIAMQGVAHAQTADASPSASSSDQVETVTVTANRRSENIQKVPMAISAVSAETAEQIGITDAQSLAQNIPGLNFNRQASQSIPFLRGVGSPVGEAGDEPSVALYVDDVYMPAGSASLADYSDLDLDSIEVEKGPQGTLFGRNASGGVIQVHTRNPTDDPEFDVEAGYANYDTWSGSAYATGEIADNLAGNISIYGSNQGDGWGRNITTGEPTYKSWDFGGRVKLLWTPTTRTTVLLNLDHDTTVSGEGVNNTPTGNTAIGAPPFPPFYMPPGSSYYDTIETNPAYATVRQDGGSIKVTQDLDWARLVSISSYRYTKAVYEENEIPTPINLFNALITTPERTWTQELQLLSPDNSPITWIGGFYYFDDASSFDPLHFTGLAVPGFDDLFGNPNGTYLDSFGLDRTHSYAGFGQATMTILPDTHLTTGLRYTDDTKSATAHIDPGSGVQIPELVGGTDTYDAHKQYEKLTARVVLDHEFADDIMGYIGYNRGFKSGFFNDVVLGEGLPPAKPETLDSYTAGAKTEFYDNHLLLNTEAFYYNFQDIQIDEVLGGVTNVTNAAGATIYGLDVDSTAIPMEHLSVTGSVELLDGHYTNFPDGQFFIYQAPTGGNCAFAPFNANNCTGGIVPPHYNPVTGQWNLKGNETIQTPPFSFSLTVAYVIPSSVGPFDVNVNLNHTGNYYADADNGEGQVYPSSPDNDRQKVLNLLNGSIGWNSDDGRWGARFWAKNITNVEYWSFAIEDAYVTQHSAAPPRTFGITLTTRM
ncbi:MAG TPA: TonB-dependent receptor [Tepidisphaeraceae bacterium]|nr:TonB-dependent receptor [Tepidisphaeraceae bacterium]